MLRTLPLVALPLMAFTSLIVVGANQPCAELGCLGTGLAAGLAVILGLIGFGIAVAATVLAYRSAEKSGRRIWLTCLVICLLAPLPVGFILSGLVGDNRSLQDLSIDAGLILTPLAALVYSWYSPRGAAEKHG